MLCCCTFFPSVQNARKGPVWIQKKEDICNPFCCQEKRHLQPFLLSRKLTSATLFVVTAFQFSEWPETELQESRQRDKETKHQHMVLFSGQFFCGSCHLLLHPLFCPSSSGWHSQQESGWEPRIQNWCRRRARCPKPSSRKAERKTRITSTVWNWPVCLCLAHFGGKSTSWRQNRH